VASAAKTKMVMLTASGISPRTANVEKGTTVVWVNNTNGSLGLFFSKGKEVEAVCAAPSRFALDSEGDTTRRAFRQAAPLPSASWRQASTSMM